MPYGEGRGKTVSSTIESIDEAVIAALSYRLKQFEKLKRNGKLNGKAQPDKHVLLMAELKKSKRQLSRLHDLLEQGIYDANTFFERSKTINEHISTILLESIFI